MFYGCRHLHDIFLWGFLQDTANAINEWQKFTFFGFGGDTGGSKMHDNRIILLFIETGKLRRIIILQ